MMQDNRLAVPVTSSDHVKGTAGAPVTLVEYGDFQCPYCGAAYPMVKRLRQRFGDQLRFVFREFPLSQAHEHAEDAAEAAEAAGAQGKFWPMYDELFQHQQALDDRHLRQYAADIGLDQSQFDRALAQHSYADEVRQQLMGGVRSGANGTPTFFINGRRYDGAYDFDSLSRAIGDRIRQAEAAD